MSLKPSSVLDLSNWYLTLPIGEPKDPVNIYNPELQSYEHPLYFHLNEQGDAVCFSSFSGGITTKNTLNPRSELREMKGTNKAIWSTTRGTHTMTFTGCTLTLPITRPSTVIGQIHRGSSDVIEIRCWRPKRSTKFVIDVFHDKIIYGVLNPDYKLGDKYTIKVVAKKGSIKIFYEDMQTPKLNIPARYDTCFFKAGSYIQCNPTAHGAMLDETTESWIYALNIQHQ
jgi:hypothetical protein